MVTLDIKLQFGQIGIQQTPPRVNMDIKAPKMALDQQQPDFILHVTFPRIVDIDQEAALREIGLVNFLDSMREMANEGQANALAAIARYAQLGDRLAKIEDDTDSLADILSETPSDEKEINIICAPRTPPRVHVQEGRVEEDIQPGHVKTRLIPGDLGYAFNWGKVKVFLEKEPFIQITAKGTAFDQKI